MNGSVKGVFPTEGESEGLPLEFIERRIYRLRDQSVMLDFDLAEIYQVSTGNLNLAVSEIGPASPPTSCSRRPGRRAGLCYCNLQ